MRFHHFAALIGLAIIPQILRAEDPAAENMNEPLSILFIGNSYTYTNEMPQMLQGLAASRKRKLDVVLQAPGGYTLEKHWQDGKAAAQIASRKWDVVVLQEHSQGPFENAKSMKEYATKFHELIKKQGAKTALFVTWARQDKPATQRLITKTYEDLAKELGATAIPVGVAWQKVLSGKQAFALHAADKSHPSELGSYLTACVFFAELVDKKTEGLPGELVFNGKTLCHIPTADAARLQRAARDAVREEREKMSSASEKKE